MAWKQEMDRRDRFNRTISRDGKPFMYIQFHGMSGFTPRGDVDDELDAIGEMVAAAPAMLEALERISRLTGAEPPTEDELTGKDDLHYAEHLGRYDAAVIARAAIAQARGIGQNIDVIA